MYVKTQVPTSMLVHVRHKVMYMATLQCIETSNARRCVRAAGENGKVDQVFAMKVHVDLSNQPVPPPPPPPKPAPPPPPRPLRIEIVSVQYGANCNASTEGDFRCDLEGTIPTAAHCPSAIRERCNGKPSCNFTVITPLIDPCPFHLKHFSVTFRCDNTTTSPLRNNTITGEASGHPLFMACA